MIAAALHVDVLGAHAEGHRALAGEAAVNVRSLNLVWRVEKGDTAGLGDSC